MVLLRYKSRDGGDRTQMEGKSQVAFIWRPSSPGAAVITSLTGVGGFLSRKRMVGCFSYVCWWISGTIAQKPLYLPFQALLSHPYVLKYGMHALSLVHNKAQIAYLCCLTKTYSEHTADGFSVKNHQPLRFQKCIFSNSMPIFI